MQEQSNTLDSGFAEKPFCGGGMGITLIEQTLDGIPRYYLECSQMQYGLDSVYRMPIGHIGLIDDIIRMMVNLKTLLNGKSDANFS